MYNPLKIESLRAELRGEFDYSDLLRDMAVNEDEESEQEWSVSFNPYSYLDKILLHT